MFICNPAVIRCTSITNDSQRKNCINSLHAFLRGLSHYGCTVTYNLHRFLTKKINHTNIVKTKINSNNFFKHDNPINII